MIIEGMTLFATGRGDGGSVAGLVDPATGSPTGPAEVGDLGTAKPTRMEPLTTRQFGR